MSTLQTFNLLLIFGLVSCNMPERNSEKITRNEDFKSNKKVKDTTLISKTTTDTQTIIKMVDTLLLSHLPSKKKINKKYEDPIEVLSTNFNDPSNYIIPGSVRNTFTRSNDYINFTRIVKNEEDKRIGCSGGGNSLSFSVKTLRDTFLFENEMLKTLNFKYNIEGGIYWENSVSPNKGKIKGVLLLDKSWQIEIDLWIKTRDMQNNREYERRITLNEKFTQ